MLKLKTYFTIIFCLIVGFSCSTSDSPSDEIVEQEEQEEEEMDNSNKTVLTITNGMTFTEINTVLNSALSGDIVEVESGIYNITGELAIKSGISIHKQSSETPIFTALNSSTSEMLEQYWSSNNSNIDIEGIQFENIRINLKNASNTSIKNCVFDYGRRKSGTTKLYTQDAYIQLYKCVGMEISESVFKRRTNNSGRGIYTVDCTDTKILNNTIGNGADEGYFVSAINDNSNGTIIRSNTIKRVVSWVNSDETDHGIYVHSFNNVVIEDNTISGWPTNSQGGAIKLRNGDQALIKNNTLTTSGLIMYVYNNTPDHPYLKNVEILNNTISVSSSANDIYHGIGYWRDTTTNGFYEESINITGNNLPNGTIKISNPVNPALFNKSGGGVFNNDIGMKYLAAGVNDSENY